MREINNRLIGKVQQADFKSEKAGNTEPQFCGELEETCINDFSNPKAETLGRSQVNKTDNLQADVAFGLANPDAIDKSDKLFNLALAKLEADGDPQAYEKACAISTSEDAKALLSR